MEVSNVNFLGDNDFESDEEVSAVESSVESKSANKTEIESDDKKEIENDDKTEFQADSKTEIQSKTDRVRKKEKRSGVVYLSSVPTSMNVKKLSEKFSHFGELGRIFLKPEDNCPGWKKNRKFSEGWVEFADKRVARLVAATLNNNQVGGKRHNPWYYDLWNIRYLKRFKWLHLNEKINSEKAARKKKLKMEISRAKKETGKFKEIVEREQSGRKVEGRQSAKARVQPFTYKQQRPSTADGNKSSKVKANDDAFLNNIFSGGFT